ncbi:MAG: N-acetylmuramoyl-L-alanine amidase [Vallitalea sp.]|jgi:N-acetylmuramoyl-L-alanine amidase|nr:N-acetylmuramoyl-L-alanine amidase [Vallitalea sp.]
MKNKIEKKTIISNVKLIINNKKNISEVANELNVSVKVVSHWISIYQSNKKKKRILIVFGLSVFLLICLPIMLLIFPSNQTTSASQKTLSILPQKENVISITTGTVFIDPGHGFSDPGAQSPEELGIDLVESEVVLDIGNRVAEILKMYDYNVIMSRTENYNEVQENKFYKVSLENRVKQAEESNSEVFISLHINVYEQSSEINGYDIYYCEKDESYNSTTEKFANEISESFIDNTGITDINIHMTPRNESFYVTRKTTMPSILFEMGYATNVSDATRLLDNDFKKKLSVSIAKGIINYFNQVD